jgi:hypothetical protein
MKSRDAHARMTSGLLTIAGAKIGCVLFKDAAKAVHEIEEEPMAVTD